MADLSIIDIHVVGELIIHHCLLPVAEVGDLCVDGTLLVTVQGPFLLGQGEFNALAVGGTAAAKVSTLKQKYINSNYRVQNRKLDFIHINGNYNFFNCWVNM